VGDAVALGDDGVFELYDVSDSCEERLARTEQHGHEVDLDRVEEPELQTLSGDVSACDRDRLAVRGGLACRTALATPSVTNVKPSCGQSSGGRWVTTNTGTPTG
jgi:hypothetical protein